MNNNATGAEIDYPSVNTCPHCGQTLKQVKYVYGLACEDVSDMTILHYIKTLKDMSDESGLWSRYV